jgi:hypothetical protein
MACATISFPVPTRREWDGGVGGERPAPSARIWRTGPLLPMMPESRSAPSVPAGGGVLVHQLLLVLVDQLLNLDRLRDPPVTMPNYVAISRGR